VKVSFGEFKI
jgi:hypothetical protein